MVTHDPRISDMADRILNMEDGKIFNALSELRQLKVKKNFYVKEKKFKKKKSKTVIVHMLENSKKEKLRSDGRPEGNNVAGTANNGGAADQ